MLAFMRAFLSGISPLGGISYYMKKGCVPHAKESMQNCTHLDSVLNFSFLPLPAIRRSTPPLPLAKPSVSQPLLAVLYRLRKTVSINV